MSNASSNDSIAPVEPERKTPKFVVGLDFGTTYTSVAFAHSESQSEVKLVNTWPGGSIGNNSADQVPTKLDYAQSPKKRSWGYQVSDAATTPAPRPLKWSKLLLQRPDAGSQLAAKPAQRSSEILQELGITPVKAVADFLVHIRETTLACIKRTYWMENEEESKVDEPECGATYSLKAIQPNNLSLTLASDLISYKITGTDPLRVEEVVAGAGWGSLCGSVFHDQRFEEYIRRILGDKMIDAMKPRSKEGMMRSWEETVKFKYEIYELRSRSEDVKGIFDHVVDRVIALVSRQVSKVWQKGDSVKTILLVGGFGSSEYLMKRLEDKFGSQMIEVLQPVNAAIARGALLRGFDGSIVMSRRAPRYYGGSFGTPFTGAMEMRPHTYLSEGSKSVLVHESMEWHVGNSLPRAAIQGALIEPSGWSEYGCYLEILANAKPNLVTSLKLHACDDDPPAFIWQNPSAVYQVCTMEADLSRIPRKRSITAYTSNFE
ncbi:hypothetical protein BZA05DRAFT_416244 [Tricharina praecox]|uniref:uncharacterized protein n=1 Tax=Tricharina praecox TaxID=43433 RepID=UPI0022205594|nr:uncharacterized protein BZA05DRAFT_416244 [Tricharina praecox]KAI5856588.1 hypothetical protein BZA05DRAFT_416244 [Tricharina praecox]